MKTIRWGIIGVGDVCEVKSGPAFAKAPGSELAAVMRRNGAKAKDFAQRHGVPKWSDDASALLDDPEIDALYIATPPHRHADYALEALESGKHVYVEKPMATDGGEARRILKASEHAETKLVVAHYRRKLPLFVKIKELLSSGELGNPRLATLRTIQPENDALIASSEENWRTDPMISGGGIFHDLAPHQLDLMLFYFGDPESVRGSAHRRLAHGRCDDCVAGQIRFPSGVVFQGYWDFASEDGTTEEWCEILCDKGSLRFSFFRSPELRIHRGEGTETIEFPPPPHIQQPMIEAANAYFRNEGSNPCHARDGVKVMDMIDGLSGGLD